jgi:hypothetical protein
MTDVYIPGFPDAFRIVSSRPEYAVSEKGYVLNLRTNRMMHALTAEDGSVTVFEREEKPGHIRTATIDVKMLIEEAFPVKKNVDVTPEFEEKRDALALFLFNMNNGPCESLMDILHHPDYGLVYLENYLMDAHDILRDHPHLLGLETRDKMKLDSPTR